MQFNRNLLTAGAVVIVVMLLIAFLLSRSAQGADRTFRLSDFGLELTVPGTLNDLAYTVGTQQGVGTVLHMNVLDDCEIGVFYEIQKDAIASSRTSWTEAKLEQFAVPQNDETPAQVKEFTNFYLVFEPSQAACSENEREIAREQEKRIALWNSLVSARFTQ